MRVKTLTANEPIDVLSHYDNILAFAVCYVLKCNVMYSKTVMLSPVTCFSK